MPIRNVGTLIENLVVSEAAALLVETNRQPYHVLEFINSFAMPPLSEWTAHPQDAGFDTATLDRVLSSKVSVRRGTDYPSLLQACLLYDRSRGPNAALLVAGTARRTGIRCRMWLNDIRDGRYGDATRELARIDTLADAIFGRVDDRSALQAIVSSEPYPESIASMRLMLEEWAQTCTPTTRLGFLDPFHDVVGTRKPGCVSSADHREWLRNLGAHVPTISVLFTGNQDHAQLSRELLELHNDASAVGFAATVAFKRQHYAAFAAAGPAGPGAGNIIAELERRVHDAWAHWCERYGAITPRRLRVARNGQRTTG